MWCYDIFVVMLFLNFYFKKQLSTIDNGRWLFLLMDNQWMFVNKQDNYSYLDLNKW